MMNEKEIVKYCLESLKKAGVDKANCELVNTEKQELNVDSGEISLLRTNFDSNINIRALINNKKGNTSINKLEKEEIDKAIKELIDIINSGEPDPANDIADIKVKKEVNKGIEKADMDIMYNRITNYLKAVKSKYPKISMRQCYLQFNKGKSYFENTNGVEFTISDGFYYFVTMFSAKEGKNTSSFNYTYFTTHNLDKELLEYASIERLLKQSEEQTTTTPIKGKFIGDVIVTPDCIGDFVESIVRNFLGDYALITGNSVYKDKLNEKIASEKLSIYSNPLDKNIVGGNVYTDDGFEAKNTTIIDKGILNTFSLSLYGANKTKQKRIDNDSQNYIIEKGDESYQDMIKSVKKGILLCRFSGGEPSDNGDFSGIAKNSYYIENGEIKHPLSETMISANLVKMLNNIVNISKERVNFGYNIYPYVHFKDITISGK